MDNGGQCVMTALAQTMQTWLVLSWATPEAIAGGRWEHWGECLVEQLV